MQTFLPYPDFVQSAKVLDRRRLGKQRLEARQILRVLHGESIGWRHHPAVQMWQGYETGLEQYLRTVILEWVARGYINNMTVPPHNPTPINPSWLGNAAFHAAHRSNLLRKNPVWYGQFGWSEGPNLPYVWPRGNMLSVEV